MNPREKVDVFAQLLTRQLNDKTGEKVSVSWRGEVPVVRIVLSVNDAGALCRRLSDANANRRDGTT